MNLKRHQPNAADDEMLRPAATTLQSNLEMKYYGILLEDTKEKQIYYGILLEDTKADI